jgi:hypothetical protein
MEHGRSFDFSNKCAILTGGGWKVHEDSRITVEKFRKQMQDVLGVKPEHCVDLYGMVEGNGWMSICILPPYGFR